MGRKQILIVDGYNVIGNWPELAKLKETQHFADARDLLLDVLQEYQRLELVETIVVFDAMYVPGLTQSYQKYNLQVVFTSEGVTADSYIEQLTGELNTRVNQVTVVTSDQAEQWTVFSRGALRISSFEFYRQIQRVRGELHQTTQKFHQKDNQRNILWNSTQMLKLEKLRDELQNHHSK